MTGIIVRHGHEGGDIPDYHEPVWTGSSTIRDRKGRPHRNAGTTFAMIVCNNPGCAFEALLDVEEVIREQLGGRRFDGFDGAKEPHYCSACGHGFDHFPWCGRAARIDGDDRG